MMVTHLQPLPKRGFKAPRAYGGQHYHVLSVCAYRSSSLMLIGRLLLLGRSSVWLKAQLNLLSEWTGTWSAHYWSL